MSRPGRLSSLPRRRSVTQDARRIVTRDANAALVITQAIAHMEERIARLQDMVAGGPDGVDQRLIAAEQKRADMAKEMRISKIER
jgi:hypothetical protein